jgi:hypothetical protein
LSIMTFTIAATITALATLSTTRDIIARTFAMRLITWLVNMCATMLAATLRTIALRTIALRAIARVALLAITRVALLAITRVALLAITRAALLAIARHALLAITCATLLIPALLISLLFIATYLIVMPAIPAMPAMPILLRPILLLVLRTVTLWHIICAISVSASICN